MSTPFADSPPSGVRGLLTIGDSLKALSFSEFLITNKYIKK